MDWSAQVFQYCERGHNPAFWAEPANALSNLAFLVAATAGLIAWRSSPPERRGWAELGLIALVALIGAGSFAFHTLATRLAQSADVIPIAAFMFAYATYALRRFVEWTWTGTGCGLLAFAASLGAASLGPCPHGLDGLVTGARCLNGSFGYLPALAMLGLVGCAARWRGDASSSFLLLATIIFAIALAARSIDLEICTHTHAFGAVRGTHALWHLLNAVVIGLMLAAIFRRDGGARN